MKILILILQSHETLKNNLKFCIAACLLEFMVTYKFESSLTNQIERIQFGQQLQVIQMIANQKLATVLFLVLKLIFSYGWTNLSYKIVKNQQIGFGDIILVGFVRNIRMLVKAFIIHIFLQIILVSFVLALTVLVQFVVDFTSSQLLLLTISFAFVINTLINFSQAPYVLVSEDNLSVMSILLKSKQLIKRQKIPYILLCLFIVPMYLMSIIIIPLWVYAKPLMMISCAHFYDSLLPSEQKQNPEESKDQNGENEEQKEVKQKEQKQQPKEDHQFLEVRKKEQKKPKKRESLKMKRKVLYLSENNEFYME